MAAGMKAVRQRIRSIEGTRQVTRAMELVAAARLRGVRERAEKTLPYFQALEQIMEAIVREGGEAVSPYMRAGEPDTRCFVLIGGDRGLAGAYNGNLFKALEQELENVQGKSCKILPVGKKAAEYCRRREIPVFTEKFSPAEKMGREACREMARLLCGTFAVGKISGVRLCYTQFLSVLSCEPRAVSLLPLGAGEKAAPQTEEPLVLLDAALHLPRCRSILWEPNAKEVLAAIVPEYVAGCIYGALCQSIASETAARRNAMDTATQNAEEMLEALYLSYNRARQAGITQEIAEIAGGERI